MPALNKYFIRFKELLRAYKIKAIVKDEQFTFSTGKKKVSLNIPLHLLASEPEKLSALLRSKLGLNKKIFARNCTVKKIDKITASEFLDKYHLMNSTQSAYNYGLFLKEELLAVASFSKGRKMNRLPAHLRSYELIRFCSKEGITVTGGLTRLVKNFCREKSAGDIMTYINRQFSSGESFIRSGFTFHSYAPPHYFLVNKKTWQTTPVKNPEQKFDTERFYLWRDEGNIKLVYNPGERV